MRGSFTVFRMTTSKRGGQGRTVWAVHCVEQATATATADPYGMTNKRTGNGNNNGNCNGNPKDKYGDPFDCVAHEVP
jgi:hypothetical protein